jgi:hypothetical protein
MKKRYTNLNEEVNRIKSLFTEERLYGNLKENKLLTEQGIGKKLADALETASSSVSKAIKNVDPKLATNFLNSEINTFDDLAKHLNDYKSIWKAMGINWDYANDAILSFKKWSDTGFLKSADDKLILQVINDLPVEGDLRGMVFDLWKDSKGKYTPPKSKNQTTIVSKSNKGENVIHKVETVGGKEKIETYSIESDGIKKDDGYDPNRASEEVNSHFDGDDLVSGGGSSKITTDVLNAKGNPDNIKGEIINAIEEGFNKISGRGGKQMTSDEIVEQIKNGGVLMVKRSDGSYRVINTIELIEMEIDQNLDITNIKSIGKKDVTPPVNVPPVKDGGESVDVPTDGGRNGSKKSKNNFSSNIGNIIGQGFRYVFPTVSEILKRVSLLGPGSKFYSKQRFSIVDSRFPTEGGYNKRANKILKGLLENPARILFVEQTALITIVGIAKSIERGTLPKDEEAINTAIADYKNSEIWKYSVPYLLAGTLADVYQRIINLRKISYASCRSKAEKKLNPNDPLYEIKKKEVEVEIEACKDEVDSFFDKIDAFGKDFTKFKKEFADLSNIDQWDQSKIEKFCEEDLADKQEVLKNLRVSLTNLDDEIKNRFNTDDIKKREYIVTIINTLKNVMPALPELPTPEEVISQLMPKTEINGKKITPLDIQGLETKLNAACAEYWNKKRDVQDQIVDPDDYEQPIDTINVDPDTKESLDADFGMIEVIVEPIEIV